MKSRICDRCHQPISTRDEMLQDQIDREYLGKDICPSCDVSIKLAESAMRQAAISGKQPGEVVRDWLKRYEG